MQRGESLEPPQFDEDARSHLLKGQKNSSSGAAEPLVKGAPQGAAASGSSTASRCADLACHSARWLWDSGLTCSFVACLIFSFSGLFVKLTGGRVPVLEVCLVRSSISFGLTILLMKSANMSPIFGQRCNLRLLCARGCCGAFSMTTWYIGLFMLPFGDAVTMGLIGPAVTALVARLFLKEPLGYRGATGCVVSMVGVAVLSRPPFLFGGEEWNRTQAIGTAAILLSSVLGSGSSLTIRLIGNREPAAVIAMWFHTCTMILTAVPLAFGLPDKFALLSGKDFSLMLGVACTSFVAQLLSTRGLQMVMAAKAAAMGFTQVFYSYIMGAIFFGEHVSAGGLVGVALVLAGVLMVTMRPTSKAPASAKAATVQATAAAADVMSKAPSAVAATCKAAANLDVLKDNSVNAEKCQAVDEDGGDQPWLIKAAAYKTALEGLVSSQASDAAVRAEALLAADSAVSTITGHAYTTMDNAASAVTTEVQQEGCCTLAEPHHNCSQASGQLRPGAASESVSAAMQVAGNQQLYPGGSQETGLAQQLVQAAAEAAAALGGELCPATTASLAHSVSQFSRQSSCAPALGCGLSIRGSRQASAGIPVHTTVEPAGIPTTQRPNDTLSLLNDASQLIPIPHRQGTSDAYYSSSSAAKSLSRQVTGWLASGLLGVSPGEQHFQHPDDALLHRPLLSPGVPMEKQQHQQQVQQQQQQLQPYFEQQG